MAYHDVRVHLPPATVRAHVPATGVGGIKRVVRIHPVREELVAVELAVLLAPLRLVLLLVRGDPAVLLLEVALLVGEGEDLEDAALLRRQRLPLLAKHARHLREVLVGVLLVHPGAVRRDEEQVRGQRVLRGERVLLPALGRVLLLGGHVRRRRLELLLLAPVPLLVRGGLGLVLLHLVGGQGPPLLAQLLGDLGETLSRVLLLDSLPVLGNEVQVCGLRVFRSIRVFLCLRPLHPSPLTLRQIELNLVIVAFLIFLCLVQIHLFSLLLQQLPLVLND
mmetsp:Transcript_3770/g.7161  ORF Transcript_3770/g.7161 Transcript_3770/m.7161 type:complete len:278 (-) Transcript_3770:979-1812(-)